MKLFGQIVGTIVETAKLPVDVLIDIVAVGGDASEGDLPGRRTRERLQEIKDAAKEGE